MTLLQAYLQSPKARRALSKRPGDKGFSLIELVVVVAILAILAAVALPNFLGAAKDAQVAGAKNTLANVIKECAVKDAQGGGGTIGGTGGDTPPAAGDRRGNPITSLSGSINGYILGVPGDGNINAVTSATAAPITINSTSWDTPCYSIEAVSANDSLNNYRVVLDPNTGVVTKTCGGSAGSYAVGCNAYGTWN